MARTFKDAPAWVRGARAAARAPWHAWDCENASARLIDVAEYFSCDIDDRHGGACTWIDLDRHRFRSTGAPDPRRRHSRYFAPERRQVRDELVTAAKEYRGTGEVDIEVTTRQTRTSMWNAGYWD